MVFIPTKESELHVMNLFNTDTGENLGQLDNIKDVNIALECESGYVKNKSGDISIPYMLSHTTMTFNADKPITTKDFYKTFGIDTSNMPDSYDVQFVKFVQARKHNKRRINNKWLKRYGYNQRIVDCKGWKMKSNTDGSVEFIK